MPPPMTSIRFGMPSSSSAPVESMTRGSSCGMKGSVTGSEPAAMMHWSKVTVFAPSSPFDRDRVRAGEGADALDHRRPCAPWRGRRGRRSACLTTLSFQPRRPSTSTFGLANFTPKWPISSASEMTLAACSSAFDGMQPTLRQTPPSVGSLLDQHHLLAEVGGAEGGGVAAGAGAEHDDLAVHVAARGARPSAPGPRRAAPARSRGGALGLQRQDDGALGDLVALLDRDRRDLAGGGRRNLHRRLVGLELDERVVLRDGVARPSRRR